MSDTLQAIFPGIRGGMTAVSQLWLSSGPLRPAGRWSSDAARVATPSGSPGRALTVRVANKVEPIIAGPRELMFLRQLKDFLSRERRLPLGQVLNDATEPL